VCECRGSEQRQAAVCDVRAVWTVCLHARVLAVTREATYRVERVRQEQEMNACVELL
jgi:hypothetical protein